MADAIRTLQALTWITSNFSGMAIDEVGEHPQELYNEYINMLYELEEEIPGDADDYKHITNIVEVMADPAAHNFPRVPAKVKKKIAARKRRDIREIFTNLDSRVIKTLVSQGRDSSMVTVPEEQLFMMYPKLHYTAGLIHNITEHTNKFKTKEAILKQLKLYSRMFEKDGLYTQIRNFIAGILNLAKGRISRNFLHKQTVIKAIKDLTSSLQEENKSRSLPNITGSPLIGYDVSILKKAETFMILISVPVVTKEPRSAYKLIGNEFFFNNQNIGKEWAFKLTISDPKGMSIISPATEKGLSQILLSQSDLDTCKNIHRTRYCKIKGLTTSKDNDCLSSLYDFNEININQYCQIEVEKIVTSSVIKKPKNNYIILSQRDTSVISECDTANKKNVKKHYILEANQIKGFDLTPECHTLWTTENYLQVDETGIANTYINRSFPTEKLTSHIFENYPLGIEDQFTQGLIKNVNSFDQNTLSLDTEEVFNIAISVTSSLMLGLLIGMLRMAAKYVQTNCKCDTRRNQSIINKYSKNLRQK